MERNGSTGSSTGSSTGNGTGNTWSSTGNGTRSSSRNTGSSTGNDTGNGTGSGSRNTGNNTGNNTGSNTGNNSGHGSGSGRTAPPGGAGRALLCLALLLLLPPALALPSPARALPSPARQPLSPCLNRSRGLLEAANASLHRLKELDILKFNCTFEEVDLADITENQLNTIRACTAEDPGPGNCPVLERATFDEGKCLQGISEDLRTYRSHLRILEDPQLLLALDELMKVLGNCSRKDPEALLGLGSSGSSSGSSGSPLGTSGSSPGSSGSSSGSSSVLARLSFSERLRFCGSVLAFRVRSVTISRMLNFLSSL